MHHILRVYTRGCGCCEGDTDLGIFESKDLHDAIECAKANISPHDATLIEVKPFGARKDEKGEYIGERSDVCIWIHSPRECQARIGTYFRDDDCKVCVEHIKEEIKRKEDERMARARGEID